MPKRHVNCPDTEPDQKTFLLPSEKEHLFQVVDFIDNEDPNIMLTKCEVVGGDENGRSLLIRASLDDQWKGFFATRLFLKAIGEPHKGSIEIDTDRWIGRQFYATVKHNGDQKQYANIAEYNFDKKIEQQYQAPVSAVKKPEDIAWEE